VKISAVVRNASSRHEVVVSTGDSEQSLAVPAKSSGRGSSVNGGEFLMLALATCYCNDLYREAARLGLHIDSVEVEASAEFPGIGLAATDISYRARVASPASAAEIAQLLRTTDAVAEVHNTVRSGVPVTFKPAGGDTP
jgi:organic hydroperoxide reductase OsmC/OhrA